MNKIKSENRRWRSFVPGSKEDRGPCDPPNEAILQHLVACMEWLGVLLKRLSAEKGYAAADLTLQSVISQTKNKGRSRVQQIRGRIHLKSSALLLTVPQKRSNVCSYISPLPIKAYIPWESSSETGIDANSTGEESATNLFNSVKKLLRLINAVPHAVEVKVYSIHKHDKRQVSQYGGCAVAAAHY